MEKAKLGGLATFEMGQSPLSATVNDEGKGIPFLQGNADFGFICPKPVVHCTTPNKLCETGDILISVRAPVGDLNKADQVYCIGRGLAAIRFNDSVDNAFGWHMINYWSHQLEKVAQGSTFRAINKANLDALRVMIFPIEEQRAIARILDEADTEIRRTADLIDKLKLARQGLLHDLLSYGLLPDGTPRNPDDDALFKDAPLGRIPKEWEVKTVGDIVLSAVDGPFGSKLKTEHYVTDNQTRVVRLQNIGDGYFNDEDKAYISDNYAKSLSRHEVEGGDLLVASMGDDNHPIARACIYPLDFKSGVVKADCFRLRLTENHEYVMYILSNPTTRKGLLDFAQGVTRDRVNLSNLQRFRLALPTSKEQTLIVQRLKAEDGKIRKEEQLLAKLRLAKKGLMDDLLTGRVRV